MKQLRGFTNAGREQQKNPENGLPQNLLDEAMKKYGGMNEDALISQLLSMVKAQKASGTYDESQMLSFINSVSPHLNEAQRGRLESLLEILNAENASN